MKRRVLSFLLLLAMLVTLVPATLFVGSAEETTGTEEVPKSETYTNVDSLYDAYVTDGLVAMFDALNASDPSLDLATGKWYAKVLDPSTGKLVQSDTVSATILGGVYDADTNPTGWKAGEDGHGIGYDQPNAFSTDLINKITFGNLVDTTDGKKAVDLIANKNGNRYTRLDDWTVDTLVKVNLRTIPMQYDTYTLDGANGTYVLKEEGGSYIATHANATNFGAGVRVTVNVSGTPGASVTVDYYSTFSTVVSSGTMNITLDENGKGSGGFSGLSTVMKVTPGVGATIESVVVPRVTVEAEANAGEAFYFGAASASMYTNSTGFGSYGDGYGEVRWCAAIHGWGFGGGLTQYALIATPGASEWTDSTTFSDNNGLATPLIVTKTTDRANMTADTLNITYKVQHGTNVRVGTYNSKQSAAYDFSDKAIQVLSNAPGYVYSLRVYNRELNEEEKLINQSVDRLIMLGLSVEKYNLMSDDVKQTFLTTVATLPKSATLADVEKTIDEVIQYAEDVKSAKNMTEYDKLYVGANGEETANGGHLVSLFSTYKGDVSSNLSQGVWINKLGENNITLGLKEYWKKGANGGVGFNIYYGMIDQYGNFLESSPYNNLALHTGTPYTYPLIELRLQLGLELLPTEDFTIEYAAQYNPIYAVDENGEIAGETYTLMDNQTPGMQQYVSAVDKIGFLNSWTTNRDGRFTASGERGALHWLLGDSVHWWFHAGQDVGATMHNSNKSFHALNVLNIYTYTRDETLTVDEEGTRTVSARYEIIREGSRFGYHEASTANVDTTPTKKADDYYDYDDTDDFYFSSALPTDFYAVRIYDAVLTLEEMQQNRFADLAAYAQLDLTNYLALQPDERLIINSLMSKQEFIDDSDELASILDNLISTFASAPSVEDSLYVTDGLRVLTAAYSGFNTGVFKASETAVSWFNGAVPGESVTLGGAGWQLLTDGGFRIRRSYDEWVADYNFGVYLTPEMLPEADYTIEMITNPSGITEEKADGTIERYLDDHSTYGTYNEHAFSIGALRCINFVSDCIGGRQSGMERRWVYRITHFCWEGWDADGAGIDPGRSIKGYDKSWMQTEVNDIINYRMTLDVEESSGASAYAMYTNGVKASSFTIASSDRITNAQANNMFQLFVGMPNTIYALRVYDRILTEDELSQNHTADLVYFYDLDQTLLTKTMELFEEDPMLLYRTMNAMDFSLTKEEAQKEFNARLAALWLNFSHTAIRNDKKEGMRFYFDFDIGNAELMVEKGYKVEVGILANIGSGVTPTLAGSNYDYKVVVYDADMGKIDGFFVDEDTVALTILADNASKEAMLAGINVSGYIKLTDENGEEFFYYANTSACDYNCENLFSAYNHMYGLDKLKSNTDLLSYLYLTMNACYEADYIYLDAAAAAGGDGSKDAPFNTFEAAFEESMARMRAVNRPTYFYLEAADGEYVVSNTQVMKESDNPYEFSYFTITSANNKSTLTSNLTLDSSGFTYDGDNIYIYQFEADENGNYPDFRNLYVNGALAELAYNGSRNIEDNEETRYTTSFNRYDDGPFFMAQSMAKAKTLDYDTNPYPAESTILRTRFAYYRDQFLALRDVEKLSEDMRERDENNHNRHHLALDQQMPVENPTVEYEKAFHYYLVYQVAHNELFDIVQYDGLKKAQVGLYTTQRADATPEYEAQFNAIRNAYSAEGSKETLNSLKPSVTSILGAFSSGMYAYVVDLYAKGELTYDSKLNENDYAGVAYGIQFDYYRDALLALDEVKALENAGELTVATQPNAAGSEQYKSFFEAYKYEILAMAELVALTETLQSDPVNATSWKVTFANSETALADAPEAYKAVYKEMRDAVVLSNYELLVTYAPAVSAEDAVYGGNVPMYDPRDEGKLYVQKALVGDLSRAITDGVARLDDIYAERVAEATAAYDAVYAKLLAAEKTASDLSARVAAIKENIKQTPATEAATLAALNAELATVNADLKAANAAVTAARAAAKDARATYDAAIASAEELINPELADRYSLMDSGVELQMVVEWCFNIVQLSGVDYDDVIMKNGTEFVAIYVKLDQYKQFQISGSETYYYPGDDSPIGGRMTWLVNLDGYLSKNNEYYYDSVAGKLYYYSNEGIDGYTFAYPQLDNMLYFENVSRVTVFNMDFTGMDDMYLDTNGFMGGQAGGMTHVDGMGNETNFPSRAPIYVYGKGAKSKNITIMGCDFYELPGEGVTMHGRIDNIEVMDCSFENIGSAAVRVGTSFKGNTPLSNDYGALNVTIENNYLDYIAQVFYNAPAIVMACSADVRIAQNTIMHTAYSGVSIGWCWDPTTATYEDPQIRLERVEICNNYIIHFMMEMGDGGAIYTLGGNAVGTDHTLFNKLHDNFIVFSNITGDGEKHFYAGIYHDGSSSNWETYRNVVVAQSYGAISSENKLDSDPNNAEYLRRLRNRYERASFFFAQYITGADAKNITFHDNYFVNSRAKIAGGSANVVGSQHREAFSDYIDESFFIYENNTRYVRDPGMMPSGAENIAYASGCEKHPGDPSILYENDY